MHHHCEIVMPATGNVEAQVARIMEPFSEDRPKDEDGGRDHSFWDWYVLGGRYSGQKALAGLDDEPFWEWLKAEKVTVSGITCGKQTLFPPEQAEKVDAKWREMFPDSPFEKCPLFDHSGDSLPGDVMRLDAVSPDLEAHRVIIAGRSFDGTSAWTGPVEALFMLAEGFVERAQDSWNGLNHMKTSWDGKLSSALEAWNKSLEHCREEYARAVTVQPDFLVVTVDYHS